MDTPTSFQEACERRRFDLLQDSCRDLSKRDAVDHLHRLFPHKARAWLVRNFAHLMSLTAEDFQQAMHADPTGDEACRRAMGVAA